MIGGFDAQRHRRVGLDTMCFLYLFEDNLQFIEQVAWILGEVESGRVYGVASVLAVTECLTLPLRDDEPELVSTYRQVLRAFPHLDVVPVTFEIAELGAELRARHGLRTPDALHIATAIDAGAQAFVTADRGLRCVTDLDVLLLEPGADRRSIG